MGKNLKKGTWPGVYNVNRVSNNGGGRKSLKTKFRNYKIRKRHISLVILNKQSAEICDAAKNISGVCLFRCLYFRSLYFRSFCFRSLYFMRLYFRSQCFRSLHFKWLSFRSLCCRSQTCRSFCFMRLYFWQFVFSELF